MGLTLTHLVAVAAGGTQTIGDFDQPKSIAEVLVDHNNDQRLDLLGKTVTVSGRAAVASFVFHRDYFTSFLQDADAAIMLYSDSLDQKISAGDSLVVSGKLKLYYGKPEIVIDSLYSVDVPNRVFPPIALNNFFKDPERYLSHLVEGEAIVTGMNLSEDFINITISPADTTRQSMWVYISRDHTFKNDFKFSRLSLGDRITITGILAKYIINDDVIYEIMPRYPGDIGYVHLPKKIRTAILWGAGILLLFGLGWIFLLRKQVKSRTIKLSKALDDNKILLQEFHHRVKNNLSMIVGLIELKIMAANDNRLINSLEDTKSRINSLALIHDKLYQKKNFREVRLDIYLKDLVEAINSSFRTNNQNVESKFSLEPVKISVDKAVTCGLLVNELVVNAFKHAFCDNKHNKLEIVLEKEEGEEAIQLSIKDNGPGIDGNFTDLNSNGIGSMLIESIAEQLDAELEIDGKEGMNILLRIPIDK